MMTKVAFPARCAVAVIYREHLLSQVYPAAVPIETFLDSVLELVNDDLRRRGSAGLDSAVAYELQRPNGTRLDVTRTLDELGIEDGATLVLAPAEEGESFEPQYESLSTGLARISKQLFAPVTAETAASTAVGMLSLTVLTLLGLVVHSRMARDSLAPALVAGTAGVAVAAGALWVWRWWPHRHSLLDSLAWLAVPLLSVCFAAAAPGSLGSAHLFIAALSATVFAAGLAALTRRHLSFAAATVVIGVLTGLVAALRMWQPIPAQRLGMSVLIGLLILLAIAPGIALRTARLRPPHFGSITGRDLFDRTDGMPVDAVAPVPEAGEDSPGADEPDTTPGGADVAAAAKRANAVLTGICLGAALALPAAVWLTLIPGQPRSNGAALLSLLLVLIFISRARSFTDRRQAVCLVCGGAAAFCAGVMRYVVWAGSASPLPVISGAVVLAAFAGSALFAGLLVPATRFTPLVRMAVEWLELLAITAALPLAAWIGGLFTWVRMR